MARWCLRNDYALNDDEKWNTGCTDDWGAHHSCKECPYNRYMGDGKPITNSKTSAGNSEWPNYLKGK